MSEDRWETFARTDAEFYIYSVDVDFSTEEGRKHFFDSGQRDSQRILSEAAASIEDYGLAIEIGCGIGRLAIPMSDRFDRVIGVDISPTMLQKLMATAQAFDRSAITGMLDTEDWDQPGSADFVYSWLVFQHIEDLDVIERYISRVAKALSEQGAFYAQFDTRPRSLMYLARSKMPDFLLPRTSRRGIRRIRRSPEDIRALFARHGFKITQELRPETPEHTFILKKA